MFVVRSLFWLTAAYLVIKPAVDLPDAEALSAQAVAAGTRVVAEQIENVDCDSIYCIGGKMAVTATLQAAAPTAVPVPPVPMPRARPQTPG